MTLRGPTLAKDFEGIVVDYIEREMPISACFDSPGPLTMQPITATFSPSTPG
jgi:hypothetical protein